MDHIQPAQLHDWATAQAAHGRTVVLDVREPWELDTACVQAQGFALVKIPMQLVPQRLSELDPEQPVAVLCHHGARSLQVASFLEQQGFSHVANLTGGIHAWSAQVDGAVPTY